MLYRKAALGQIDVEARSVPVVLATDFPVQRDGFLEILDLSKVDLSRGDLPLIESHDADNLNIGVIRLIQVDGNKLRGVAVFGTSARASEVLADVKAGIITGLSIGYLILGDGEPTVINGQPARTFGFMPYEASAVAIPADPTAGFFRSRKTISLPKSFQGSSIMETVIENRNHAVEIGAMARQMSLPADLVLRAIAENKTVEEFQKMAIEALALNAVNTGGSVTTSGTGDRAADTMRVLRNAQEIREHYATRGDFRSGVTLSDFLRGAARMKTSTEATRALAIGTDASGGYALPSSVMPRILEALVPASSLLQAGAGILPVSEGAKTFNFAAVDAVPVATWRLENGSVDESEPTFKNIAITPRSLSFVVKVSRELLADAPNIETAINAAIAQAFAIEIDRVGLLGTGTAPQPRGLKNTSGIQTVTNGAAGAVLASYANIFSGVEKILTVNGPMPTAAIMAPRSLVKLGGLADTTGQPLQVPGMLQGVKLLQTSQLPINLTVGASTDCSEIYLGDFSKMFICMRESLNIQVLTETYAGNGQIGFMCHARVDVAVQYPQAFCLVSGVR
jgi:HK97 family phage major capsid protein